MQDSNGTNGTNPKNSNGTSPKKTMRVSSDTKPKKITPAAGTVRPRKTTRVLSAVQMARILAGFAKRIANEHGAAAPLVFVGIRTRGPTLARRVADVLKHKHDLPVAVGELDTTLYRDDLNTLLPEGSIDATRIPFEVGDKTVILFDDVLHTGRTARAAVDHLMALGRPRAIFLAVMVDRGGRELPIEARLVGKQVELRSGGDVRVRLNEVDGVDEVVVA